MTPRLSLSSVAVFFVVGCAASHPAPSRRAPDARGSSAGFSHPPVVDGSRRACLAPPYAPAITATALADGTPIRREADGRRWVVSLHGESAPSAEDASALVQRLRAREGLFTYVSYGLYCGERLCLHYAGNLCEMRIEDTAHAILAAVAEDPVLPHPRIDLALELAGALGPRCTPDDHDCGPVPYDQGTRFDPDAPRYGGAFESHSVGTCTQDGDCVVGGCGNHCMSWEYGGANEAATCEGYVFPHPVFCGCVSNQCGWFTQASR